ncbi:ImuA family protein [Hansschlegelia quercus]|uniref:DNA repair protein n=1 Tax=Hansschlegelia quercus TaxID=2528245 RepID=A0A4Q9GJW0_9HYPH|nr:DNA repair protein [Hansschlegelia quercus]TBN51862.1 DNA repair protein [Hansschlegelia quercus]
MDADLMALAAETLDGLRAAVSRIEAEAAGQKRRTGRVAFGISAVDEVLGGGLRRGALHAVAAASAAGVGAATGFAAALAGLAAGTGRTVLWVRQDMAGVEHGEPWAPGLSEIGLDPGRIVFVRATDAEAALKAAETALSCRGLAAVLIEPYGALGRFDRVAGRRLALAAGRSGALALMLRFEARGQMPAGLVAAETRWRIAPLASAAREVDWGGPRALVELARNRLGALGRWPLGFSGDERAFRLLAGDGAGVSSRDAWSPNPGDRAAEPRDRQDQAAGTVPLRRAG